MKVMEDITLNFGQIIAYSVMAASAGGTIVLIFRNIMRRNGRDD